MIRSMTGFGRAEGVVHDRKVTVEVRSLNSKQLDLFLKMPSALKDRENEIRQRVSEQLVRGKAEVFISTEGLHVTKRTVFDKELVRAYYDELKAIRDAVDPNATTDLFAQVLRLPDVTNTTSERLTDDEWTMLMHKGESSASLPRKWGARSIRSVPKRTMPPFSNWWCV